MAHSIFVLHTFLNFSHKFDRYCRKPFIMW